MSEQETNQLRIEIEVIKRDIKTLTDQIKELKPVITGLSEAINGINLTLVGLKYNTQDNSQDKKLWQDVRVQIFVGCVIAVVSGWFGLQI